MIIPEMAAVEKPIPQPIRRFRESGMGRGIKTP